MNSKINFRGFNTLRAFAAILVVFHHIELLKTREHTSSVFDSTYFHNFITNAGKNGVYLFFVLSGFLITYLLLKEREISGNIKIKQFYLRRILRIWPLYYFIILLSFGLLYFLFSSTTLFHNNVYAQALFTRLDHAYLLPLVLYLLFLPNLALAMSFNIPGASQAWSVGVEEQFYIIWPFIIKFFKRLLLPFLILLIVGKILLNAYASNLFTHYNITLFAGIKCESLVIFIKSFRIEYMAIGALFAYIVFKKLRLLEKIMAHKIILYVFTAGLLFLLIRPMNTLIYVMACACLITSIAILNEKLKENKILSHFGKISYGIYMYHPFVMFLLFPIIQSMGIQNMIVYNLIIYSAVFGATLLISSLSYNYLEKPFLRLKTNYTTIKSGDSEL